MFLFEIPGPPFGLCFVGESLSEHLWLRLHLRLGLGLGLGLHLRLRLRQRRVRLLGLCLSCVPLLLPLVRLLNVWVLFEFIE